jgi:uncharacterized membrane protein
MAVVKKRSLWSRFLRKLRDVLIAGLVVTVPIGLTIWIFIWLFNTIDGVLKPLIKTIWNVDLTGVGFGVLVALVLIVGLIGTNVIGKRIVHWGESLIAKIPISRTLYEGIRQMMQSYSEKDKTGFLQVVMVEYPRKGVHTLAFVTNEYTTESGEKMISVFIPNSPNPMSGFLHIFNDAEITRTQLTVEEGLKLVVSAGRMASPEVGDKMWQANSDAEKLHNRDVQDAKKEL